MNVNYYCDELISEIVMKFEETQEQFIFQTIGANLKRNYHGGDTRGGFSH